MWQHKKAKLVLSENPGGCERKKEKREISATTCRTDLVLLYPNFTDFHHSRKRKGSTFLVVVEKVTPDELQVCMTSTLQTAVHSLSKWLYIANLGKEVMLFFFGMNLRQSKKVLHNATLSTSILQK